MKLPLFIIKTGGTKCWFVRRALKFLGGPPWPKTIIEPFAGSAVVGLSLLHEGCAERLVLAEKDKDYRAFWRAALGDPNFSYRVAKWTEQVLELPFEQQQPFVIASLKQMKWEDPGFWILLRSRIGFNGKKKGGYMTDKSRGGILCRWPRTLATSLDLLYSLRNRITVMEDGFRALAEFDSEDSYGFIDPPYTVTDKCPGHQLYDEAVIDHSALLSILENWRGRFQLTYNLNPKTILPRIYEDALSGLMEMDIVQMTSGSARGGSKKKWELVASRVPRETDALRRARQVVGDYLTKKL